MSKVSFNKLLINWKSQETKKNYLVGVLEKKDSKYTVGPVVLGFFVFVVVGSGILILIISEIVEF